MLSLSRTGLKYGEKAFMLFICKDRYLTKTQNYVLTISEFGILILFALEQSARKPGLLSSHRSVNSKSFLSFLYTKPTREPLLGHILLNCLSGPKLFYFIRGPQALKEEPVYHAHFASTVLKHYSQYLLNE